MASDPYKGKGILRRELARGRFAYTNEKSTICCRLDEEALKCIGIRYIKDKKPAVRIEKYEIKLLKFTEIC